MKKLSLYCMAGLLLPVLYLNPIFMKTDVSLLKTPVLTAGSVLKETTAPAKDTPDMQLT